MNKRDIIISLDCMGGDRAPDIVINGADISLEKDKDISFLLYGDEKKILPLVKKCRNLSPDRYEIFHTDEFISAEEKPSIALRKSLKSSMRLAIESVKNQKSNAVISAGNTGALMVISKIILKSLPLIDRPAIISFIPNRNSSVTVMLDLGANVDCDSSILYQFAVMGYAFARTVLKIEKPKIGILNIGSEDLKGNDSIKSAASLLKDSFIKENFHGYVEGDDIVSGIVDVIVTDGFSGNIALKSIEGTASMIGSLLKESFSNSIFSKIGYLFSKSSFKEKIYKNIDPRLHNGAMFVGLNGIVVKSHGGTDALGFSNAIKVTSSLVREDINKRIISEINRSDTISYI